MSGSMTAAQILSMADELVPNPFSTQIKLFLFNQIEQRIRIDTLGEAPETVQTVTADSMTTSTCRLDERYLDVYLCWLKAQLYWNMGEYDVYENERAMFEAAWDRFERDVCYAEHMGTGGPETDGLSEAEANDLRALLAVYQTVTNADEEEY